MKSSLTELEDSLKNRSYPEIELAIDALDIDDLIVLLGGRSRRVGSSAWSLLGRRNAYEAVAKAFRRGEFPRKDGRIRALNLLKAGGRRDEAALLAYRHALDDRSGDVIIGGLHGCVWSRDRACLPRVRELAEQHPDASVRTYAGRALEAFENDDPTRLSPGYRPHPGLWE